MNKRKPGIYCESFGHGPPLVLIHGWGMHGGIWRDFVQHLANRMRVTLVDLPGHGRSEMSGDFSLETLADRLAEIAPPPAHWLGWSLGVLMVLGVAQRHPERVRKLVLLAGTPRFVAEPGWPGVEAAMLDQFAANLERDFVAATKRFIGLQTFGLDHPRDLGRKIESRLHECEPPSHQALRAGLHLLRTLDLRDVYRRLPHPALSVLGVRDRLAPAGIADALRILRPDAPVHVLENAAHLPFLTHSEITARLMLDFLLPATAA
jgi:pimeloyl-[acyl-carrier protein] methyl ester esterase